MSADNHLPDAKFQLRYDPRRSHHDRTRLCNLLIESAASVSDSVLAHEIQPGIIKTELAAQKRKESS